MNKIYIDCDGVILDTENGLFDKYEELVKSNPTLTKEQYITDYDFDEWYPKVPVWYDAINILKSFPPENIEILTKVNSLNEGRAKVEFFRKNGVLNNIILVPPSLPKNEVVDAKGNILIDDGHSNLDLWKAAGGIPVYLGRTESYYPKAHDLRDVLDPDKRKKLIKQEKSLF